MTRKLWWLVPMALVLAIVVAAVDFVRYQSSIVSAVQVVSDVDGRMTSIGGWPLGRETYLVLDRKLRPGEVRRLQCLSAIRGSATIGFACPMTDEELEEVEAELNGIAVVRLEVESDAE